MMASRTEACNQLRIGAAVPTLWQVLRSTLEDELYEVDHSKTTPWPSHGGCTADEVVAWPEFGPAALSFMDDHRELLQRL